MPHSVLNARFHESEAHIVAQAGRAGAVTIATNMAGRGTDIKLGGSEEFRIEDELKDMPEGAERDAAEARIREEVAAEREAVKAAGGLFVLATECHESRRIDNQLRGRSGRQGDPGLSKFYLCLDDDLLRIFGPDTLFAKMMNKNLEDGEAIGSKWLSKAIETAQKKVEARNYDIRKQVVEYDDVMNDQRKVVYEQRADIMDAEAVDDVVAELGGEHALGERETDGGGDALAEGTGGGLDARRDEALGVARRLRMELAEALQLIQRHLRIAGEIEKRVEQHRAVAGRQDEAVAVGPVRVGRIEFQVAREQDRGDVGHAHRHAGMAGLRLLDGVHGEGANRIGHTGRIDARSHGAPAWDSMWVSPACLS